MEHGVARLKLKNSQNISLSKKDRNLKTICIVAMTNYLEAGAIIAGASGLSLWNDWLNMGAVWVGVLGAISANAFGAAIGAAIGGRLTDKYGRKKMFVTHLVVYLIGILIIMFSWWLPMLFIGFLVTGIAVGIGVPASWTYISEANKSTRRAARVGASQLAWSIGPTITFLVAVACSYIPDTAIPVLANRVVFLHLFVIVCIVLVLQRSIKDSEAWQRNKTKNDALKKQGIHLVNPLKKLFSKKVNIKSLLFLVGVYLFWNLVAGAQGFFMPYVYETVGGLSNTESNLINVIVWALTSIFTAVGFMLLGDRISRRLLFGIGAGMALVAWLILTFVGMASPAGLWLYVVLWGISAGIGAQAFYVLWASELFPTEYRGAAQGFMYFLVRLLIGIWSIFFPYVINALGFQDTGIIMIVLLAISLVIGVIWTPKTLNKTTDEIEIERYGETQD